MERIETERLILREFEIGDAEAVLEFGSHPEVCRYTCDADSMTTLEDARKVITGTWLNDYEKYGYGRLAVVDKASQKVFGFCGMKYLEDLQETDIGYRFLPEFWGRGIATEATQAVLQYGRSNIGLTNIIGLVVHENIASQRVLVKLGFQHTEDISLDNETAMVFREPTDQRRFSNPLV
jgi:RimJ/RimL family protein N-acetyltransferase